MQALVLSDEERATAREVAAKTYWDDLVRRCHADPNTFIETIFRDDQTSGSPPFRQQWFHREWQEAFCSYDFVVLHGATGFGKTEQIVGYLLWRIGLNPTIRILIVTKSEDRSKEILAKIKRQIETNEKLQLIFPRLKQGDPWGSETLRVADAGIDTVTNTVTIYGINSPKAGPRADVILCDDIDDAENTRTEERRLKTQVTVESVLMTRLTTKGQVIMPANAWHPDDCAFTFAGRRGVWHGTYPAILSDGSPLWPDFRPLSWLEKKREKMTPTEFARMFLCQPRDEHTKIFKDFWFKDARALGSGIKPVQRVNHAFAGDGTLLDISQLSNLTTALVNRMRVYVGVDLATGETEAKRKTDFTVFFVLGVRSDGKRQVLWIEKGRWDAGESVRRLLDIEARYRPEVFAVESNGTQKFFHQFARLLGVEAKIQPFITGANKWSPTIGIEAIGIELQARQWVIPDPIQGAALTRDEQEALSHIRTWEKHLADFQRTGHTSDVIMASWFAQARASGGGDPFPKPEEETPPPWNGAFEPVTEATSPVVPEWFQRRFG